MCHSEQKFGISENESTDLNILTTIKGQREVNKLIDVGIFSGHFELFNLYLGRKTSDCTFDIRLGTTFHCVTSACDFMRRKHPVYETIMTL